jgi:uncharacterized protein YbjT (DUF2867 family)
MRIAVAGATGRIGRLTIGELERAGNEPVPISRRIGVDAYTGAMVAGVGRAGWRRDHRPAARAADRSGRGGHRAGQNRSRVHGGCVMLGA